MDNLPQPSTGIEGPIRNLRTETMIELKQSNRVYNECFSKTFLPRWLKGEQVNVSELCGAQYDDLLEKHLAAYDTTSPIPFRTFQLPTAE